MKKTTRRSLVATLATAAIALTSAVGVVSSASAAAPVAQAAGSSNTQWLTGYWHNFNNNSAMVKLSQVPAQYNMIVVSFVESISGVPGGVTFKLDSASFPGGYTVAQFKSDIAALKAQGRKVIISVGGEAAHVNITNSTEATNFTNSIYNLMQEYGFDGVDIDLEHGINADALSTALHNLRNRVGSSLIITMAPQTIDYQYKTAEYYKLTQKIADILTITNTQYYNSGSMLGYDGRVYSQGTVDFLVALSVIQLEMGLRPDQVGIGVPAVQRAAGGGYQAPANIVKAIDCLETQRNCGSYVPPRAYGKIGGAMTWSINWDATNNYQFANTVGARLDLNGSYTPPPTTQPPVTTAPPTTQPPTTKPPVTTAPPTTNPGTCSVSAYNAGTVYTEGNRVSYNGQIWQAMWWTQGETPGTTGEWGVWRPAGNCTTQPPATTNPPVTTAPPTTKPPVTTAPPTTKPPVTTNPGTCSATAWNAGAVYWQGDVVSYNGKTWRANWWTQGDTPADIPWTVWTLVGSC